MFKVHLRLFSAQEKRGLIGWNNLLPQAYPLSQVENYFTFQNIWEILLSYKLVHKIRVVPLFVIVKEVYNNVGFNANLGFLGTIFI